jgi:NADH dehydrogenase
VQRGSDILPQSSSTFNKSAARKALSSRGVTVVTDTVIESVDFSPSTLSVKLSSNSNTTTEADLIVYTYASSSSTSHVPHPYGSIVDDSINKIRTDPALRVTDPTQNRTYRNVFSIGDCASVQTFTGKPTAQTAMGMAEVAAFNVYSDMGGGKVMKFKHIDLGEMLTLGTDEATISSLNDNIKISGGAASFLRRAVYSIRQPTGGQRVRSGLLAGGKGVEKIKERKINKGGKGGE